MTNFLMLPPLCLKFLYLHKATSSQRNCKTLQLIVGFCLIRIMLNRLRLEIYFDSWNEVEAVGVSKLFTVLKVFQSFNVYEFTMFF